MIFHRETNKTHWRSTGVNGDSAKRSRRIKRRSSRFATADLRQRLADGDVADEDSQSGKSDVRKG